MPPFMLKLVRALTTSAVGSPRRGEVEMQKARKMDTDEIRFSLNADQMEDGRLYLTSNEMKGFTSIIDDEHGIGEMLPALEAYAKLHFGFDLRNLRLADASANSFSFAADKRVYA
jgi:hypothetical protein